MTAVPESRPRRNSTSGEHAGRSVRSCGAATSVNLEISILRIISSLVYQEEDEGMEFDCHSLKRRD